VTLLRQSLMDREDEYERKDDVLSWQEKQVAQAKLNLEHCQNMLAFNEAVLEWEKKKFELIHSTFDRQGLTHQECVDLEKTLPPYPKKPNNH